MLLPGVPRVGVAMVRPKFPESEGAGQAVIPSTFNGYGEIPQTVYIHVYIYIYICM